MQLVDVGCVFSDALLACRVSCMGFDSPRHTISSPQTLGESTASERNTGALTFRNLISPHRQHLSSCNTLQNPALNIKAPTADDMNPALP